MKRYVMEVMLVVAVVYFLGCATKQVGRGRPFDFIMESTEQIVIEYDSTSYSEQEVITYVQQYAQDKYGKVAVLRGEGPSRAEGYIITLSFKLEEEQ
jgi:hypothetical protein